MKKAGLIAMFLITLFLICACAKGPDQPLRCMSFNIRYDTPDDGGNTWPLRQEMVARTFSFHRVDVAGLQEALNRQVLVLAGLLPEYDWIGVGRDDGREEGEYVPIFYRRDRLRLIRQGTFWLSPSPDSAGSRGWDAALPRIATWVEFSDRATGKDFFYFNTHFDHIGVRARQESSALILRKISALAGGRPVILSGDFNSTRQEGAYLELVREPEGMKDSEMLSVNGHYGGSQSFTGFNNALQPNYLIDFIFVKGIRRAANHGLVAERWDGRFVSDHYPVIVDIYL
ncbi:MAG TPA: endonuclease/exonuclease/phosphatase family protein [bacterium]|nr:endonuclease/exonuclease/phosphatase family protein [bacterium]HPM59147.1 endonuclease/exonuclease/phosphatase family protein [bacterium]